MEGHIEERRRKYGTSYRLRVHVGNSKYITETMPRGTTRRQAEARLLALLDQPLRVEGFVPTRPPFPASAAGWKISQVVDTDAGTFVVAVPPGTGRPALYRIDAGRLVVLRDLDPGMLSAVGSLPG